MAERRATVTLAGGDGTVTSAYASLVEFSPAHRAMRAGMVLAGGIAAAAALIPIPIIHLLGIPLVLLAAIGFAFRQLRTIARLSRTRVACPRCGAPQWFGGAAGLRQVTAPVEVTCDSCRRGLTFSIDTAGG